jgi:hypothetical protein
MKLVRHNHILLLMILFVLLLLLIACSVTTPVATITPTSTAMPTKDLSGLSPDVTITLSSLTMLDDYPFYVMHYVGQYDYPQIRSTLPTGTEFSCSLFAALGETGDMFYGRNFDWDFSPALLLFTNPPDGYASVSMVDLTFLGIDSIAARTLTDLPLAERTALLEAPSMPFDGMNEYGLTIGMAALPDGYLDDASFDPSRPTIGSIGIIRQALDHARDVDEAVMLFQQYNIDFAGGPPIHYLIADPTGKAILIEFYQGEMIQLPNEDPWHLATNHMCYLAEGDGGCPRYHTISERLTTLNGQLDPGSTMQLLSDVKQSVTQWSSVYNMTNGDINVAISGFYDTAYKFHLDMQ